MILNAFDMKFHDKHEGMPPKACRRAKKNQTNLKIIMHEEMDPVPARPPERRVRGAQPPGK